jgi:hypothetical protein
MSNAFQEKKQNFEQMFTLVNSLEMTRFVFVFDLKTHIFQRTKLIVDYYRFLFKLEVSNAHNLDIISIIRNQATFFSISRTGIPLNGSLRL